MLSATFYEPGPPTAVAAALRALEEPVVAVAAPLTDPPAPDAERRCDAELRRRGMRAAAPSGPERALAGLVPELARFSGSGEAIEGTAPEGAFRSAPSSKPTSRRCSPRLRAVASPRSATRSAWRGG